MLATFVDRDAVSSCGQRRSFVLCTLTLFTVNLNNLLAKSMVFLAAVRIKAKGVNTKHIFFSFSSTCNYIARWNLKLLS